MNHYIRLNFLKRSEGGLRNKQGVVFDTCISRYEPHSSNTHISHLLMPTSSQNSSASAGALFRHNSHLLHVSFLRKYGFRSTSGAFREHCQIGDHRDSEETQGSQSGKC